MICVSELTGIDGSKAHCFNCGMKIRCCRKDPTPKKHLTFGLKYGIIKVSCWQTCQALPLGNVSAYPLDRG